MYSCIFKHKGKQTWINTQTYTGIKYSIITQPNLTSVVSDLRQINTRFPIKNYINAENNQRQKAINVPPSHHDDTSAMTPQREKWRNTQWTFRLITGQPMKDLQKWGLTLSEKNESPEYDPEAGDVQLVPPDHDHEAVPPAKQRRAEVTLGRVMTHFCGILLQLDFASFFYIFCIRPF